MEDARGSSAMGDGGAEPAPPDIRGTATDDASELRARIERIDEQLARLAESLGAAVLDGDEALIARLDARMDGLAAHRAGLLASLAYLRSADSAEGRERRRRAAAEWERQRRALAAARDELYQGWAALLEHRAAVLELTQELDRLKQSWPVERSRLEELRRRLAEAGVPLEIEMDALEACDDPEPVRAAARHYRELAGGGLPDWTAPAGRFALIEAGLTTEDRSVSANQAVAGELAGGPEGPAAPDSLQGPAQTPQPQDAAPATGAQPEVASGMAGEPARPGMAAESTVGDEATVQQELRRLEEEDGRLRRWHATLDAQGDPLGVKSEVERQLAEIADKRRSLLAYLDDVRSRRTGGEAAARRFPFLGRRKDR